MTVTQPADPPLAVPEGTTTGSLARASVRGGAASIAAQLISFALNLLATLGLARMIAPGEFGIVGMITAFTGLAITFKDLGLSLVTVQRQDISHAQVNVLFWLNAAAGIVLCILFAAASPLFAAFYQEPRLTLLAALMSLVFIPAGLSVQHRALLQRGMRFQALGVIEVVALLFGIAAAVLAASAGVGAGALILMQLTTAVSGMLGTWLACTWRPSMPRRGVDVRQLLQMGRDLSSFNVTNYVARNIDDVLIGRMWGAVQLGLYTRAYQLMTLPIQMLTAPLGTVAIPLLSRLTAEPATYRRTYLRLMEKVLLLTVPGAVFAVLTADILIVAALGEAWTGAARIFMWLGVAALTQPLGNSTGWLFVSQGRTRELHRWGIAGGTLIVVSVLIGLPWGGVGVAASYALFGLLVRTPLLIWYTGRRGPISAGDLWRVLLLPCGAGCVTALGVAAVRAFSSWGPGGTLVFAAVLAILSLLLFVGIVPAARHAVRDGRAMLGLLRA